MRAAGLSERTVHERCQMMRRVEQRTGKHPATLTNDDILHVLAWPRLTPGTRATYYYLMRAWFKWLRLTNRMSRDPMCKIEPPRVPRRHPRPIASAHLEVLLATPMRRRTRVMILLAAYQGLRVHEIAKVRADDVDVTGGTLTVNGKGGVVSSLPLHPIIAAAAKRMPARGWWFPAYEPNVMFPDCRGHVLPRSVSTIIGKVMERAGVPGTPHSLRHWHATELLRAGADSRTVQTLMRHASLATTQIYMQVADDARKDALGRLPLF